MRTYTEEKPKYVQRGTYTETYHVKKWEDLTAEQKDEVVKEAMLDRTMAEWYDDDERNLFFDMIENLKEEYNNLLIIIRGLEEILADENKLKSVMKDELRKIKNEYARIYFLYDTGINPVEPNVIYIFGMDTHIEKK